LNSLFLQSCHQDYTIADKENEQHERRIYLHIFMQAETDKKKEKEQG